MRFSSFVSVCLSPRRVSREYRSTVVLFASVPVNELKYQLEIQSSMPVAVGTMTTRGMMTCDQFLLSFLHQDTPFFSEYLHALYRIKWVTILLALDRRASIGVSIALSEAVMLAGTRRRRRRTFSVFCSRQVSAGISQGDAI